MGSARALPTTPLRARGSAARRQRPRCTGAKRTPRAPTLQFRRKSASPRGLGRQRLGRAGPLRAASRATVHARLPPKVPGRDRCAGSAFRGAVRWEPARGLAPHRRRSFSFPAAERTGLIGPRSANLILTLAGQQDRPNGARRSTRSCPVAVNVSPLQLLDPGFSGLVFCCAPPCATTTVPPAAPALASRDHRRLKPWPNHGASARAHRPRCPQPTHPSGARATLFRHSAFLASLNMLRSLPAHDGPRATRSADCVFDPEIACTRHATAV